MLQDFKNVSDHFGALCSKGVAKDYFYIILKQMLGYVGREKLTLKRDISNYFLQYI